MSIVDTGRSDPLMATLKLLADPEEMQRRYAALQTAEARAKEVIALVGPAEEIVAMRKQIAEDLEGAKTALGEARMQAGIIVDDARRKVQAIEAEIAEKQKAADADVALYKAEAKAARDAALASQAELKRLQAEYQGKLADVDNLKTQLEHEKEALVTSRVAFENRLHSLADIVEQFRGALGAV